MAKSERKYKAAKAKVMEFRGIGMSEYVTDFKVGIIPIIKEDDSEEIKQKKRLFIRKKLGGIRRVHQLPLE